MFEITKNTLMSNMAYKQIKMFDENYNITVAYTGDYQKDYQQHKLDKSAISIICKPKIYSPYNATFKWYHNGILFEIPNINICTHDELKELRYAINFAIQSKTEFEKIFYKFFPSEYLN